ncbi:MAG TPA: hypothetical protein ENJ13_10715 [Chromatiales bacterium]|nr:hypothetical protein [Chromatiales bacterium]
MRYQQLACALLFASQLSTSAADVPSSQQHEVEHLLNFVASTPCIIERNGSHYNGQEALSHIKKKYAYFRDKINSTETFIEYAASRSTFSGNAYTVQCGNNPTITTRQWLLDELSRFRNN